MHTAPAVVPEPESSERDNEEVGVEAPLTAYELEHKPQRDRVREEGRAFAARAAAIMAPAPEVLAARVAAAALRREAREAHEVIFAAFEPRETRAAKKAKR